MHSYWLPPTSQVHASVLRKFSNLDGTNALRSVSQCYHLESRPERLGNLPEVTQPGSHRARMAARSVSHAPTAWSAAPAFAMVRLRLRTWAILSPCSLCSGSKTILSILPSAYSWTLSLFYCSTLGSSWVLSLGLHHPHVSPCFSPSCLRNSPL